MRRFAIAPISGILLAALTSTIAASGVDGSYNCSSTSACFSASQTAPAGSSGAGFHGSAVNSAGMRGSSTNSVGLLGQSASGTFLEPGVEGETTVAATGGNLTVGGGFGLSLLTGGQGPSIGVVGTGTSYGVEGENASNSGSESPGVVGIDKTGETAGTVGESNATASTTGGIGVAGFLGTPGGTADVVGTAVFGEAGSAGAKNMNSGIAYGGYFVSDQSSDETVGIAAESTSDAAVFGNMTNSSELDIATGSDLLNGTGSTGGASFYVDQSANIYTSGSVTAKGTETSGDATYRQAGASGSTLTAYGMRSASPEIEDVGEAQLVNGRAIVHIDAKLADVLDRRSAYHVFLTPEGDGNALYVAQKTPTSFVVAEQRGGRSTMAFDYRIIAQPYAHSAERLAIAAPLRRPPTPFAKLHPKAMRSPSFITPPDLALRTSLGPQRYAKLIAAKRKELSRP